MIPTLVQIEPHGPSLLIFVPDWWSGKDQSKMRHIDASFRLCPVDKYLTCNKENEKQASTRVQNSFLWNNYAWSCQQSNLYLRERNFIIYYWKVYSYPRIHVYSLHKLVLLAGFTTDLLHTLNNQKKGGYLPGEYLQAWLSVGPMCLTFDCCVCLWDSSMTTIYVNEFVNLST